MKKLFFHKFVVRLFIFSLIFTLLDSCTHITPAATVNIAQNIDMALLLPRQTGTAIKKITGTFRNEQHTLIMQIQSEKNKILIAGLTPTGTRLFSISFDGQHISSWESPLFHAPFDGSYILADLQLSILDTRSLQNLLPTGTSVTELSVSSTIERHFTHKDGTLFIRIRYSDPENRAAGSIDYCHLERDYCLHIENIL